MYRPVIQQQQRESPSIRTILFSDKNYNTLQTVLIQDFEQRNGVTLNNQQIDRLSKTLNHYLAEVYQKQGDKPVQILNKEVLTACAKDFSQYLQRKELTKNTSPVKNVMDNSLFEETSKRFERLTGERNEVKALPPPPPDFRMDFSEDGPPAAELYELARKQRDFEALRSAKQSSELLKAEMELQTKVASDSMFKIQQDSHNRTTELALAQRQQTMSRPIVTNDIPLTVLPDRRELLTTPIGSFDTMTASPAPRDLGQANSNPTTTYPELASPVINNLPQNYLIREDKTVNYREIENNLFIYSADRDWLRNNSENRYSFTVHFDPAANGQNFNPTLSAQQKFKNIVRIELIKCIMPGESLDVTINKTSEDAKPNTNYFDSILNFPYLTIRIPELDNNNYGTDNFLDRSFGVLQYDAKWISDETQNDCTRGYIAMIPKFLKCQKDFYPTPLSTLQKMTIDILRPNGEVVSKTPDTFDITGIIGPNATTYGVNYPFNVVLTGEYAISGPSPIGNSPANFYIVTNKYFSRFEICKGDRIQIGGYNYSSEVFNDPTYGIALREFGQWINRQNGHIVLGVAYTNTTTSIIDGFNDVGYANVIIIQAKYQDPTTGSTLLEPFGQITNISDALNTFGVSLQSPCRLIDLNKQLNLVFRVITREMDAQPQIRPDNNY
jgi:hypothetical protein